MIAFGPIPSRRLGLSLGINNIPSHKVCSYSCAYCQIGITVLKSKNRESFYQPEKLYEEVKTHLNKLQREHVPDYLTFVANGEPTLEINLGREIRELKKLGIPVAVITNASLMFMKDVRNDLMLADWVSVKVDTVDEMEWMKINQPQENLDLSKILDGIKTFSSVYKGKLNTETMLLDNYTDSPLQLKQTAAFISGINPYTAYLSIPTRPPALKEIKPIKEENLAVAWQIYRDAGIKTELLTGFEGTGTGFTGNAFNDILSITSVHPLREDTMKELLKKEEADSTVVNSLISQRLIKKVKYNGMSYYVRTYNSTNSVY